MPPSAAAVASAPRPPSPATAARRMLLVAASRGFRPALQLAGVVVLIKWLLQLAQLKLRILGVAGGPFPLPVVGTVHRLLLGGLANLHRTGLRDVRLFGHLYCWAYFHKPMVNTSCPHHLRRVLVTHWRRYDRSDVEQAAFGELLGRGLILVGNDQWRGMRQVYQSGFSDRNILAFRAILRAWSGEFASWLSSAGSGGREPVDIQEAVQNLAFRIVGLFTLGVDFESEACLADLEREMGSGSGACKNYGQLWFKLLEHTQMRVIFGPFRWWKLLKIASVRAFERGHALLLKAIDQAIDARAGGEPPAHAALREGDDRFHDLLSLMVGEKAQGFSREEIRHQALTFLFAGHDTTTNLISWCLHLLAERPAELERARAEVKKGDTQFLRCCLLETLRLYPSAPARSRTVVQQDSFEAAKPERCPLLRRPGAVDLAPGTGVSFAINAVHRDPAHWPEPDAFRPGRFGAHCARAPAALLAAPWATAAGEEEGGQAEQPLRYLPFGAGPRRCIGERFALLEAEEIVSAVLRRCAVRCAPGFPAPVDEMHLTMRARDGIHLLFLPDADDVADAPQ